jgi:hypothetical protein
MKKLKIFIIVALILITIAIAVVCICRKTTVLDDMLYANEPDIENSITIKAKEIHTYMEENNYGYCTYDNRCDHDGECGLNSTFEASKTNHHNTCCATYVSWVLQEAGYLTKQEHVDNYLNGANNLIRYLTKKGWKEINKKDIQPGDILCYNGHIAIYGGKGKQYDAGNRKYVNSEAPCKISWGMSVEKILRAPDL